MPTIVTKQELIDWVKAQPTDRPVRMQNNLCKEEIGCVMVQYGKEKFEPFYGCGYNTWQSKSHTHEYIAEIEDNTSIYRVLSPNLSCQDRIRVANTFGEIQQVMGQT